MSELQLTGFELIEKIGEGGMGHVWKARQLSLDRLVAIKLLPPRFSHDPESVKQIIQEARIAAKLKHPGIVQVYDANEQNGTFYFVMEYVDGYNVGHWVARKKQLGCKDALIVVESVATALNYAWHASELIHCDLKLENVMVDQDGTIKVADLGLSLTRDSQTLLQSDEVAGTPGYISPEQVTGEKKLDCRTDIYALGCCLYHMITGRRPFQDLSDSDAMEAQVNSFIPDPREIVPTLPGPVCILIERMLVKNRDQRLKDWQTVLAEVHRVQRGLAPVGPHPEENASTMRRRQIAASPARDEAVQAAEKKGSKLPLLLLLLVAVAAGAGGWYWSKLRKPPAPAEVSIPPVTVPVTNYIGPKSTGVSTVTPVPPKVARTPKADAELAEALEEIQRVTDSYVSEGNYPEAIHWLENYFGRWASATATNRSAMVVDLRRKMGEAEALKRSQTAWLALTKEMGSTVLTGKYAVARQSAEAAVKDALYAEHKADLAAIIDVLTAVAALNDKLLETFSHEAGKVATIPLGRGEFIGRIVEIRDRKIACKTLDGTAQVDIRLKDIAPAERLRRLAALDLPEAFLVRGVGALSDGKADEAIPLLAKSGPVLGPLLIRDIQLDSEASRRAAMATDESLMAFLAVLKKGGGDPGVFDAAQWRKYIDGLRMPVEAGGALDKDLESYLVAHGKSRFAEQNADLILALQKAIGQSLDPDAPKAAPAEAPEAAVGDQPGLSKIMAALIAKNEGLTQEAFTLDETSAAGKLAVRITASVLKDLTPLAEFKEIASLVIEASSSRGGTLDIGPLAGMPLRALSITGYEIQDVSKLRGMRLSRLAIPNAGMKSLAFLQGMPLTVLDIRGAPINDLTSLQGMRLESLHVDNTKVASVTALSGMPLRELGLKGTQVRDVTYLQGMPLERLDLSGTQVNDFSPLHNFKLTSLGLAGTTARDLSFCAEMPLTELDISGTTLPSLMPLTGKSFKRLILGDASIRDVSAFKSMKVAYLDLSGSRLSASVLASAMAQSQFDEVNLTGATLDRIDFLRNSRTLRTLNMTGVKVADLSPLAGLPIESLNIRGVPAGDIATLRTLTKLRTLQTDIMDPRLMYVIKAAPGLTRINGTPTRLIVDELSALLIPNKAGP